MGGSVSKVGHIPSRHPPEKFLHLTPEQQQTILSLLLAPDKNTPEHRRREFMFVDSLDSKELEPGTQWHLVNAVWFQMWLDYTQLGGPPPGPITNAQLLDAETGE